MYELICEYCNKKYFHKYKSRAVRSRFCCRKCQTLYLSNQQSKKATIIRECPICKTKFKTTKNHGGKKSCSQNCANILKTKRAHQSRSKNIKKIDKECPCCHKKFSVTPARKTKIYCSNKCRGKHKSIMGRTKIPCAHCGQITEFINAQIKLRGGKYCSKKCLYASMSKDRTGKNNPNWTGGHEPITWRGPNWNRQRRIVRQRDDYTCQKCKQRFTKKSRKLHVHHIVPFRLFKDDYKSANQVGNLVCLCASCHSSVESKVRDYTKKNQVKSPYEPGIRDDLANLI